MAEVKQYLKKIDGSKYMADRRIIKKDESLKLQVFSTDEFITKRYKPLGRILTEMNVISADDLDNALKTHWKKGGLFGEVLMDLGLVSEEDLSKALLVQEDIFKKEDQGEQVIG